MPLFTNLTPEEQSELIIRTASQKKVSPILIEKDFWVCWVLKRLFSTNLAEKLTFKGGTSLSKCYGIINRFSEDCDITIDKSIFEDKLKSISFSKKQFKKMITVADTKAVLFVRDQITTKLNYEIQKILFDKVPWSLAIDKSEEKNLRFYYPSSLSINDSPYIKKSVLIETGVRGEIYPSEEVEITSYIEENFPDLIEKDNTLIKTLSPVRTFWEKITLLHAENNRPADKKLGDRISRHYYDIYQLLQTKIVDRAMEDLELLYDVIDNKTKYFPSSWTNYNTATPGTLSIVPNDLLLKKLKVDYQDMNSMIFGDVPAFELVMNKIFEFQLKFNNLTK